MFCCGLLIFLTKGFEFCGYLSGANEADTVLAGDFVLRGFVWVVVVVRGLGQRLLDGKFDEGPPIVATQHSHDVTDAALIVLDDDEPVRDVTEEALQKELEELLLFGDSGALIVAHVLGVDLGKLLRNVGEHFGGLFHVFNLQGIV